jgi:hypothetical protein
MGLGLAICNWRNLTKLDIFRFTQEPLLFFFTLKMRCKYTIEKFYFLENSKLLQQYLKMLSPALQWNSLTDVSYLGAAEKPLPFLHLQALSQISNL